LWEVSPPSLDPRRAFAFRYGGDGENGSGDWRWAEGDEMILEDGQEISQGSTGLDCGLEV